MLVLDIDVNKVSETIMRESCLNSNNLNTKEISKIIDEVQSEKLGVKRKRIRREKKPRDLNKGSIWLNIIAFFIPIWGIFCIFFDLYKYPKRSRSVFIATLVGLIIQIMLILFIYFQLYEYIEKYFVLWFG